MSEKITLENLSDFITPDELEEDQNAPDESPDRAYFRNYSKKTALIIGYMLGVKTEHMKTIPNNPEEYIELEKKLEKDKDITAIRHLNNIRTSIMLSFKDISRQMQQNLTPIDTIDKLKEDFKELRRLDISIYTGRYDLYEYIKLINNEINKRIDSTKKYFPDWLNFHHIKHAFVCPTNINFETEGIRFSYSRNFYPYHKYFYWQTPEELGNILLSDDKLLKVLYKNCGETFTESERVIDTSDAVKENIHSFIKDGIKIQIFIDGENVDPYRFSSMINGLSDEEVKKIEKIVVYYDVKYSLKAWNVLKRFVRDIDVELIGVERIYEEKSLVDHKLVAGVSKAVYKDNVDSIMLCSSDSDFWTVIENVEANYIVMVESDKCGREFKEILKQHNVFFCYTDKFIQREDDYYLETVLDMETQGIIDDKINNQSFNLKKILDEAIKNAYATLSPQRKENIYNDYVDNLKIDIDDKGNMKLFIDIS